MHVINLSQLQTGSHTLWSTTVKKQSSKLTDDNRLSTSCNMTSNVLNYESSYCFDNFMLEEKHVQKKLKENIALIHCLFKAYMITSFSLSENRPHVFWCEDTVICISLPMFFYSNSETVILFLLDSYRLSSSPDYEPSLHFIPAPYINHNFNSTDKDLLNGCMDWGKRLILNNLFHISLTFSLVSQQMSQQGDWQLCQKQLVNTCDDW